MRSAFIAMGLGFALIAFAMLQPAFEANADELDIDTSLLLADLQATDRLGNGSIEAQRPEPVPMADGSPGLAPLDGELLDALADTASEYDLIAGETVRSALTRWSGDAGWTLVWHSPNDYPIDAPIRFPAGTSYREAVRQLVKAMYRQHPGIKAQLYKNNVLVISESGR